ncbi:hypothetical protein Hanom_Chr00s000001g01592871 [Helianthus anomalus]
MDLISTNCLWVQHIITLPRVTHPIKHNRIPYTLINTCILLHSHYYSYGHNEYSITVLKDEYDDSLD